MDIKERYVGISPLIPPHLHQLAPPPHSRGRRDVVVAATTLDVLVGGDLLYQYRHCIASITFNSHFLLDLSPTPRGVRGLIQSSNLNRRAIMFGEGK